MKYDAIIVGARCAGASTAMLLARQRYRVLLLDRAQTGDNRISSHLIHAPGVARLRRWDLLERAIRSNCPPIYRYSLDLGTIRLTGCPPALDGGTAAYCVPRHDLAEALLAAAIEAGVEVREGTTALEVLFEHDRAVGVRTASCAGATAVDYGRILIGADGLHSFLARSVRAPEYRVVEPLTCSYSSYWSGLDLEGLELYAREGRFVTLAPTYGGFAKVTVFARRADYRDFRVDIEHSFSRTLDLMPRLAKRVRAGFREERFVGATEMPSYFRQPFGPGWVLVGDAGYHRDPLTAQGVSDAFRSAELLAEALDHAWSGRTSYVQALTHYQRERDHAALPMYQLTCQWARLNSPSPEQQALFSALRANPHECDRYFGALAGTVPVQDFFSPDHLRRITAGSAEAYIFA